ncbi:MAG TPA: DUF4276 family protein [Phycisphaerae bacterium]|nr:DUF4276 family protein [Phycisphaerae bacterium]
MRIVVLCEGKTEKVLKPALSEWLGEQLPKTSTGTGIDTKPVHHQLVGAKFRRQVELNCARNDVLGVIGLTDVYGAFESAASAKAALEESVAGCPNVGKFRPHVALFELEAWLMPFWDDIAKSIGVKAKKPGVKPEAINHEKPPSKHLKELFRQAKQPRRNYDKVRHAWKWLTAERLGRAAEVCPELKAFLNSLLELAGGEA